MSLKSFQGMENYNMLCEYGCGNEASFTFKNGKRCCSSHISKCPAISKKVKNKLSGRKLSKEHIKSLKESHIGISPSKKTREKLSKALSGKNHPNYGKKLSNDTILKMKNSHKGQGKRTISYIKKKYPIFFKVEEMRYNPDKPGKKEIQVRCKNHKCPNSKEQDGWFTPSGRQIEHRLSALDYDGSYFYCSDECKETCPIYGRKAITLIKTDSNIKYTSTEYHIWQQEVLKRAEHKCEYCGEQATIAHHSRPKKLEPFYVLDPDFGIACCEKCHYEKGHKDECSTGNLASKICYGGL